MWKQLMGLLRKGGLCQEAFEECLLMLRDSMSMFNDAVASLRHEGSLEVDIYSRDKRVNKFERHVRRNIVTHLAVSDNPDVNTALVLTAIVVDIERIGDYTKNIVELAAAHPGIFDAGELAGEVAAVERAVGRMFEELVPALEQSDVNRARQIIGDHQGVSDRAEECIHDLIAGKVLAARSGTAVAAALYLRYLKRVSAHLKNVATSIVNPYYRIGFREKVTGREDPPPAADGRRPDRS